MINSSFKSLLLNTSKLNLIFFKSAAFYSTTCSLSSLNRSVLYIPGIYQLISFHYLFCTAQQEYSLIPYCKTNPLLSVSWLLLFLRYNVFCVEIIYKKRNHTQAKATSHSKHLCTFCNIPFSHTLAFSLRYYSMVCFIFSATYSPNPTH